MMVSVSPQLRIERQTLAQQVLDRLVLQLLNTSLKAGDRVATEIQLMEEFNVSRSSIREAVKALQNLGILDSRPALGTFVSDSQNVYSRLLALASMGPHGPESWLELCTSLAGHGLNRLRHDLAAGSATAASQLAELQQLSSKGKSALAFYCDTLVACSRYPKPHALTDHISAAMAENVLSHPPKRGGKIRELTSRYQGVLAAIDGPGHAFYQACTLYFCSFSPRTEEAVAAAAL